MLPVGVVTETLGLACLLHSVGIEEALAEFVKVLAWWVATHPKGGLQVHPTHFAK